MLLPRSAAGPFGVTNDIRVVLGDEEHARLLHGAALRPAKADGEPFACAPEQVTG